MGVRGEADEIILAVPVGAIGERVDVFTSRQLKNRIVDVIFRKGIYLNRSRRVIGINC